MSIQKYISEVNRVFKCDVLAENKKRINVTGRFALSYFLRYDKKMTLQSVGDCINKSHDNVIHYLKQHECLFKYDRKYKEMYLEFTKSKSETKRWLCLEVEAGLITLTKTV
jgi:chromosomal replication initiation ATPase DnaA